MLYGVDLQDSREEVFVRMVIDGIAMGIAFKRAGFTSTHVNAPNKLWQLDRIQERAAAILEARRTTGVVTLPEVTGMLQRVFSSAYHADEYNAAHNAALSLARLYGHVNDRQTLEVIRRPSRDPDAPSEQELSSWVESLPALNAPDGTGFSHSVLAPAETAHSAQNTPLPHAPAPLLARDAVSPTPGDSATGERDLPHTSIDWLASDPIARDVIEGDGGASVAGRPENGAPTGPVTVTPIPGGHSAALQPGVRLPPLKKKRVPRRKKQVPGRRGGNFGKRREIPRAEDLF